MNILGSKSARFARALTFLALAEGFFMVTVLFQWTTFIIFSMKSGFIGSLDRPEAKLRSEKSQKKPNLSKQ